MADNSGMIKIGVAAAVAYYAYSKGWLSSLGIGAPAVTTTTTPVAAVVSPNAITGANTIDGIYARMVAAAGNNKTMTIDAWDTFLASAGQLTPPDPMPLFQAAVPGFDRSQLLTAAQYWAVMAPALKTTFGLSGIGVMGRLARGW